MDNIMKKTKKVNYRPKKKGGRTLVPLISLTALIAVVSAGMAGIWQLIDQGEYIDPATKSENFAVVGDPMDAILVTQPIAKTPPDPLSAQDSLPVPKNSSSSEATSISDPADFTLVDTGEWVASSYFDDALFIGDSITDGIKIYDIMSNATILSYTGINLDNIATRAVIKTEGSDEKLSILDASKNLNPTKIYVMMGVNSMFMDKESFVSKYAELVVQLKELHPDSIIYVQSILPVTAQYEINRPEFANAKIDDYNQGLLAMCESQDVYYLNVAEVFKDEKGNLPTEASPKDGLHFGASWYSVWFDYLREHAVPSENIVQND